MQPTKRPTAAGVKSMSTVQNWVNSLSGDSQITSDGEKLPLGVQESLGQNPRNVEGLQNAVNSLEIAQGIKRLDMADDVGEVVDSTKVNSTSMGLEEQLRMKFGIFHQESFNSDVSPASVNSLDQILHDRRGDPEVILQNLGFSGTSPGIKCRIPDRFLNTASQANGITVEKFIDGNPRLKEYLEEKSAIQNPFEMLITSRQAQCENQKETKSSSGGIFQAALALTIVNRFKKLIDKSRWLSCVHPKVPLAEPVLQVTHSGCKYWSVLPDENRRYMDEIGFYDSIWSNCELPSESTDDSKISQMFYQVSQIESDKEKITDTKLHTASQKCKQSCLNIEVLEISGDTQEAIATEQEMDSSHRTNQAKIPERFLSSPSVLLPPHCIVFGDPALSKDISYSLSPGEDSDPVMAEDSNFVISVPNNHLHTVEAMSSECSQEIQSDYVANIHSSDSSTDATQSVTDLEIQSRDYYSAQLLSSPKDDAEAPVEDPDALDPVEAIQETLSSSVPPVFDSESDCLVSNESEIETEQISSKNFQNLPLGLEEVFPEKDSMTNGQHSRHRGQVRKQVSMQSDSSGFAEFDHMNVSLTSVRDDYFLPNRTESAVTAASESVPEEGIAAGISCPRNSQSDEVSGAQRNKITFCKHHEVGCKNCASVNDVSSDEMSQSQTETVFSDRHLHYSETPNIVFETTECKSPVLSMNDFSSSPRMNAMNFRNEGCFVSNMSFMKTEHNSRVFSQSQNVWESLNSNKSSFTHLDHFTSGSSVDQQLDCIMDSSSMQHLFSRRKTQQMDIGVHKRSGHTKCSICSSYDKCFPDITEMLVLHDQLLNSTYIKLPAFSFIMQNDFLSIDDTLEISCWSKYFKEELQLMECALQKYKLENKLLYMRMRKAILFNSCSSPGSLSSYMRNELDMLMNMNEQIMEELDEMHELLIQRLKHVLNLHQHHNGQHLFTDLTASSVIRSMSKLLQEQSYQSNIVNSIPNGDSGDYMLDSPTTLTPTLSTPSLNLTTSSSTSPPLLQLNERLSSLERLLYTVHGNIEDLEQGGTLQQPVKEKEHKRRRSSKRFLPTWLKFTWHKK